MGLKELTKEVHPRRRKTRLCKSFNEWQNVRGTLC